MSSQTVASSEAETDWLSHPVTAAFADEPLHEVLNEISHQLGISVFYDKELANEQVKATFTDQKASEVINRLFKGKNKIIQVDYDQKIIFVKTFGLKNYAWTDTAESVLNEYGLLGADLSTEEISALVAEQNNQFQDEISDENQLLAEGVTRSQLRDLVTSQNEAFNNSLANEEEVIAGTYTRSQLRELVELQNEDFIDQLSDGEQVILDDMSRAELRRIIQQQNQAFDEQIVTDIGLLDVETVETENVSQEETK